MSLEGFVIAVWRLQWRRILRGKGGRGVRRGGEVVRG